MGVEGVTSPSSPPHLDSTPTSLSFRLKESLSCSTPLYPFSFLILNYVIYSAYFMRKPAIWDFYEHLISYPAGTWTTGNARSPDREYPRAKEKNPLLLFSLSLSLLPFIYLPLFVQRIRSRVSLDTRQNYGTKKFTVKMLELCTERTHAPSRNYSPVTGRVATGCISPWVHIHVILSLSFLLSSLCKLGRFQFKRFSHRFAFVSILITPNKLTFYWVNI